MPMGHSASSQFLLFVFFLFPSVSISAEYCNDFLCNECDEVPEDDCCQATAESSLTYYTELSSCFALDDGQGMESFKNEQRDNIMIPFFSLKYGNYNKRDGEYYNTAFANCFTGKVDSFGAISVFPLVIPPAVFLWGFTSDTKHFFLGFCSEPTSLTFQMTPSLDTEKEETTYYYPLIQAVTSVESMTIRAQAFGSLLQDYSSTIFCTQIQDDHFSQFLAGNSKFPLK